MQNVSRRSFVTGGIAMAAGAALLGTLAKPQGAQAHVPGSPVELRRGYVSAHGDKSFTQVVVALDEHGTILAANLDEYQFMNAGTEGLVGVPNSDADFAAGIVEGKVLASKTDNDEIYSRNMIEKAGATQTWHTSIEAIERFAVGKCAEDLEGVDAVSGATLGDTAGYLAAIAQVAAQGDITSLGLVLTGEVEFGRANLAAHGSKAFANAVALVEGTRLVGVSIDEFQFMNDDGVNVGVPNSDGAFGENFVEGKVLASKSVNSATYSANMAEKAGSTVPWRESMNAIEQGLLGTKLDGSILELDAVSGATLVDTPGYLQSGLDAALNA